MILTKSNALIKAAYNLELIEQRIILLAVYLVRETGQGITLDNPVIVHAELYAKTFNVTKEAAYGALKEAASLLFHKELAYVSITSHGEEEVKSRWVNRISYVKDAAAVKLTFAPDIIPLITRLESSFTSYDIKHVAQLTSKYSLRLYELVIAWKNLNKTPLFQLESLKRQLGLEANDYHRIFNFKSRVLEVAIQQINHTTDIYIEYTQLKTGKEILGFKFNLDAKKTHRCPKKNSADSDLSLLNTMTDLQRHSFASKLSKLPEMGSYSEGNESYQQFAIRITEMLKDKHKLEQLYPYLKKVGYLNSNLAA